ncbi:MerR family transcriptional regulator [Nocardia sp. BSTN01]|uniref:MerR family transcriptional regulator n=1 Tax=Nocardia sp. BSTN01 TaxID=2783665 RepID=UPI00188E8AF3|nr:MerR family transcriptional regulator [Nocardia sp. BSTN01]MBF5002032.1 MerR family transcriptional regulator [Nocardia sp. BSTN01]
MASRKTAGLRTVDVARRAGCSVQQVRNLERDGVLPPAERGRAGYRAYGEVHVLSARAYRLTAAAIGPAEARVVLREAHSGRRLPMLVDAAHARLDAQRRELRLAQRAAEAIAEEPIGDAQPADSMTVSELAGALGVRPSTLRHWDAEGVVVPRRAGARGARLYAPEDVRDARIAHQLRLAGYRIPALRDLLSALRTFRGGDVTAALAAREGEIDTRSWALFEAAALLFRIVSPSGDDSVEIG